MTPLERYGACLEPQPEAAMPVMYTVPFEAVLQMAFFSTNESQAQGLVEFENLGQCSSHTRPPRTIQILISPVTKFLVGGFKQTIFPGVALCLTQPRGVLSFLHFAPKCSSTWGNRGWCRLERTMRGLSDGSWILIRKC